MKVKQLVDILQKLDQDLDVATLDSEIAYCEKIGEDGRGIANEVCVEKSYKGIEYVFISPWGMKMTEDDDYYDDERHFYIGE